MSQVEVERFLGRIITDMDFRLMAANSLEKAISRKGIVLSKEEISILNHIDFSQFGMVADILDDSIKRASKSL
ncbi:MAG TPA: Os1348 family NHLP clan protein [Dongiaceae bacterium]|nr:Os1348 family NHLP clan protein [Dongiaceae bacterium]